MFLLVCTCHDLGGGLSGTIPGICKWWPVNICQSSYHPWLSLFRYPTELVASPCLFFLFFTHYLPPGLQCSLQWSCMWQTCDESPWNTMCVYLSYFKGGKAYICMFLCVAEAQGFLANRLTWVSVRLCSFQTCLTLAAGVYMCLCVCEHACLLAPPWRLTAPDTCHLDAFLCEKCHRL